METNDPLYGAIDDADAQSARETLCGLLNDALTDYGLKLYAFGKAIGGGVDNAQDSELKSLLKSCVGLAHVIQIAGELGVASVSLLREDRAYASFALVRQIVECEYLCRAFSDDPDEARDWYDTTRAQRLRLWSPSRMRKRSNGEFRDKDYAVHCELGGHPTPRAVQLLRPTRTTPLNSIWLELTIHLANTWSHTTRAIPDLARPLLDRRPGPQGTSAEVTYSVNEWLATEPAIKAADHLPDFPDLE
jgi:hypothetical protein